MDQRQKVVRQCSTRMNKEETKDIESNRHQ